MEQNEVLINKTYKINLNNLVTPLLITMTSASRRLLAPPMYLLQKQPLHTCWPPLTVPWIQNFGNKHLFTKQYYKTCETRV
jgi:hypothetical protein